jgi:crossover junction endodeoxyribonuclease RusA
MTTASFTIPLPPSLNNIFANGAGGGRVKTKAYKAWRNAAAWEIKLQRVPLIEGDVVVHLTIERPNAASDIDNRLKPIFDCMQTAGVIKNDRHVVELHAKWGTVQGALVLVATVDAVAA